MTTDLEEFRCTSTGGAPYHLSFAGVRLETTAELMATTQFEILTESLVWLAVTVNLRIISKHMVVESMCPNDALKFGRLHREK